MESIHRVPCRAELNVAVDAALSVPAGHEVAKEMCHHLLHQVRYLANTTVHVDLVHASGEIYHRVAEHTHDGLPPHAH